MNQKTIKTVAIVLLMGTTLLSASGDKFAQRKAMVLEHLTKKIELTNTFKSCVNSSTKGKDLKSCRQSYKASMKDLRASTKAKRDALKGK